MVQRGVYMLIPGYEKDANLTILNTIYHYPQKNPETGKYKKDHILLVYKNLDTGVKSHKFIYRPEYTFYKTKKPMDYNLFFAHENEVDPVTCPYTDIEKTIAQVTNNMDFFYGNIEADNRKGNKQLHTLNNILGSDIDIEDYYRHVFDREYKNDPCSITKAYFDIEVDTIHMRGDFPEMGECPVNAISFINEYNNTVYVYLLRNQNNKLINEFELKIKKGEIIKQLQSFIIENVGGEEKAKKFGVDQLNFNFYFFDEELALIQSFFQMVNTLKPDFLIAWNMAFDIPYLIERLKVLGVDPAEIMSDPSFEKKFAEYYIDTIHKVEYEARGDFYNIASTTVYLDQLIHFASRRKNQSQFPNYKLDTAGSILVGVKKLDYSHITTQLSKLPYLNYTIFVFYNIMDTIVQKCIETKVNDIGYIFNKCLMNNTRYAKGHRQTYYLTNRAIKEFRKDGFIFGNNINKYTASKTDFEGALVNNPLHNSDYAKYKQGNEVFNIARNLDDYDYKSLYPSITRENNLAPNTIEAKIFIEGEMHEKENVFFDEYYDRGGQYIEDLISENYIEFAHRWLGFANIREMLEDVDEFFNMNPFPNLVTPREINENLNVPIRFYDDKYKFSPIIFYDENEEVNNIIPERIDFSYYLKKARGEI